MQKAKRVYVLRDGLFYQSPLAQESDGTFSRAEITNTNAVPFQKITGFKILSPCDVTEIENNLGNPQKSINRMDYGNMKLSETVTGNQVPVNLQSGDASGSGETIYIEITNTSTTADTFTVFDASDSIADALGLPALNGVNIINGTWGANSLAMFKELACCSPFKIKGLHLLSETIAVSVAANRGTETPGTISSETASDKFYKLGKFGVYEGTISNQTPKGHDLSFAKDFKGNTENPEIRERPDFEFIAGGLWGLKLTIPPLCRITVTFDVVAVVKSWYFSPV